MVRESAAEAAPRMRLLLCVCPSHRNDTQELKESSYMFKSSSDQLPWIKEYKVFGIPKTLGPYPDRPVYDTLDNAAKKFKKQGLIQLDYKMNYPEVKEHVECLATSFISSMGLQKGDRVATLLPTSIQFVIADYAISKAGLVHVPASSLEPVSILAHKFNQAAPKVLIYMDDALPMVKKLLEQTAVEHVVVTVLEDYSANPPQKSKRPNIKTASNKGVWMTDLIADTQPDLPEIGFNVEEDLELILFTGGTTGLPKGCMLTHKNIYANLLQNEWSTGAGNRLVTGCLTVLLGLPFFHSYGHIIMHTMVQMGYNQILIPDSRDTESMVRTIQTYYPLIQIGVPTQFMKICQEELSGMGMLGISGSAPLPESVQKKYEQKTKGAIMEGYGLSEMSPATHLNTSFLLRILGGRRHQLIINSILNFPGVAACINFFMRLLPARFIGYVGCKGLAMRVTGTAKKQSKLGAIEKRRTCGIPLPDTEIKLVDMDTGNTLTLADIQNGKRGEMHIKGPQRMLGYWPDTGSGIDDDGYINTGDVVTVDENGYFYIVDRTKDMINVSGYKVYSREIDDILYAIPGVEHGTAVGIPDPEREGSERVVVYIEPNKNEVINEEDVIEHLRSRVAKYAVPKAVKIIDAMPLTEVHKLNKKEIRQMAQKDFGTDNLETNAPKAAVNS